MEFTPEELDRLSHMVDVIRKVSDLSNPELAEVLVALTENLPFESYHWNVLMEAAQRLDPEGFEKA